eukprot:scaffold14832_cov129-Isochrysis_galbana.AAC.6
MRSAESDSSDPSAVSEKKLNIRCSSGRMRQDTLLSSGGLASPPFPMPHQTSSENLARPSASGPFNAQLVPRAMLICIPNGMIPVPEPLETQIDAIRTLGRLGGQDERAAALETGRDEPQRRWRQLKLALLVRCEHGHVVGPPASKFGYESIKIAAARGVTPEWGSSIGNSPAPASSHK